MKHCKCEFGEQDYEIIREAAYRSRLPIKQWVQNIAVAAAKDQCPVFATDLARRAGEGVTDD